VSSRPAGVLSRQLLPASIAIFTTTALVAFQALAVTAAIPELAADLGRVALLPWVITGYILSSSVSTVIAGPLVDGIGTRIIFRWAVGIFVAASIGAAVASTMPLLILARVVQGAGAGLISAVGLAAVGLVYPPRLVSRAFAANATVWGAMGVAGPGIAALLLTALDWRWIFLVSVPLGLAALAAGWKVLPGPAGERKIKVDGRGVLLLTVFSIAMVVGVDRLDIWSAAAVGLMAIVGYLYWQHARRTETPVLRLEHLARQPYLGLGLGIGLLLAGAIAAETYVPLYVRGARGAGPALTAWSVLFFTVGWTLGANVAGRLADRVPESTLTLSGFLVTIPSLIGIWGAASAGVPLWIVFALLIGAGAGVGAATNAGLTLLRSATPDQSLGRATAAHQFARSQGFAVGPALGGALILLVVARRVGSVEEVQGLLAGTGGTAAGQTAAAIGDGFAVAALLGAGIAALGIGPIFGLRKSLVRQRLSRRSRKSEDPPGEG
jgi:MFS family permease